ncbi:hypothetical protein GTS_55350 [Gandjariella thermophila]|uniref:Uncharacterized protein n=1 Tax=Gandjariella thermophila TaxID=1931992 RepID=A0A4D4JEP5_9PSEU|nr:hypothetical protein GTS_55350 [Gandjariella thermophila]
MACQAFSALRARAMTRAVVAGGVGVGGPVGFDSPTALRHPSGPAIHRPSFWTLTAHALGETTGETADETG